MTWKKMKVACLLLFHLASYVTAESDSQKKSGPLTVMQPSSLADATTDLEASLGNFGHITYGQTQMGKVVYPENGVNTDGC